MGGLGGVDEKSERRAVILCNSCVIVQRKLHKIRESLGMSKIRRMKKS